MMQFDEQLQVVRRDGQDVVVDEDLEEMVIRRSNSQADRQYHRPHPVAAVHGYPIARCAHGRRATKSGSSGWIWRRRDQLPSYDACPHCHSEDPDAITSNTGSRDLGIAEKLRWDSSFVDEVNEALNESVEGD